MTPTFLHPTENPRRWSWLPAVAVAVAVAACLSGPSAAPAALVVDIEPVPVNVTPGSTGNAFDVVLRNTGSSGVDVGGFTFEVSTSSADIDLTAATTSTALAYIFAGHTLFGPDVTVPGETGASLSASDLYDPVGSGFTLAGDTSVGLGRVLFDVASGASPGDYAVSFTPLATSLSTPEGGALSIDALGAGTIHVSGAAVPEPSSVALAGAVALAAAGYRWSRRRR